MKKEKLGFYQCACSGSCENYGPVTIDSWRCPCAYVCMVGESLLSNWRAWRNVWENQVRAHTHVVQSTSSIHLLLD